MPSATALDAPQTRPAWLRQQVLQCHPFAWFRQQAFPELSTQRSQYAAIGELQQAGRCARPNGDRTLVLVECGQPRTAVEPPSTTFALHRNGTLVAYTQPNVCVTAFGNAVRMDDHCSAAGGWMLSRNNTLIERRSQNCLDVMPDGMGNAMLVLRECRLRVRRTQIWHFTVKLDE